LKKFIAFILLFILYSTAYSQNLEWLNYTNCDKVFALLNDGNYLWIATDGGLISLNKETDVLFHYQRNNFKLPDNHILSIAKDSSGGLWMGTRYSGIAKIQNNVLLQFNYSKTNLPSEQNCTALAVDSKNNIYASSLMYIYKFNGSTWKTYQTGSTLNAYVSINDIKIDNKGTTWVGASWGLGKFVGDSLIQKYNKFSYAINAIAIDKQNRIWLGTNSAGLMLFDSVNTIVYNTSNSGIPSNIIYNMRFDSKGHLWITTPNGMAEFDGSNWILFNTWNSGLPDNFVLSLEIDKDDILWLGLYSGGLVKYDHKTWKKYNLTNSGLPSNGVFSLKCTEKNTVWAGAWKGLLKFSGSGYELYDSAKTGINIGSVFSIEKDLKNNLWFSTDGAIYKYNGVNWQTFDGNTIDANLDGSLTLKSDKENNLWIGTTYSGLIKYDGSRFTNFNINNSPLTSNIIKKIEFDKKGNLWLGMGYIAYIDGSNSWVIRKGGLVKFDGINWTIYNKANSGLAYDDVSAIAIDSSGAIWCATMDQWVGKQYGGGLSKFDGNSWTTYNISNSGLSSNTIFDMKIDKNQNLWLSTSGGGLVKFDRKNTWSIYDQSNSGIAFNSINMTEIDSSGYKWVAHNESGLSVFKDPSASVTPIKDDNDLCSPRNLALLQNFPNPFNPSTIISFQLSISSFVSLKIYDILGQEIVTLFEGQKQPGKYTIPFDGKNLAAGAYFYTLASGNEKLTRKLLLVK
jgi:ligand-binding sensor domain-containing protein